MDYIIEHAKESKEMKINDLRLYHGSDTPLKVGTIIKNQPGYDKRWGSIAFYNALELYRMPNEIPHRDAVFMAGDISDEYHISDYGGGYDYVYEVVPIGKVSKHDMNVAGKIGHLISDLGYDIDDPEIERLARMYWEGYPNEDGDPMWEYLAPAARIIRQLDDSEIDD